MIEDNYPTEIVELSVMEDRVANEYVVASIRISKENASKLNIGRCKIENTK